MKNDIYEYIYYEFILFDDDYLQVLSVIIILPVANLATQLEPVLSKLLIQKVLSKFPLNLIARVSSEQSV